MNTVLQLFFIACIIIAAVIVMHYLAKKKLNLKYSLAWIATIVVMLIFTIFPQLIEKIGLLVGIQSVTSTVFLFGGMFMLIIIFTLTMIVSHMNKRIYRLTQNQALLEKRIRELENPENIHNQELIASDMSKVL